MKPCPVPQWNHVLWLHTKLRELRTSGIILKPNYKIIEQFHDEDWWSCLHPAIWILNLCTLWINLCFSTREIPGVKSRNCFVCKGYIWSITLQCIWIHILDYVYYIHALIKLKVFRQRKNSRREQNGIKNYSQGKYL